MKSLAAPLLIIAVGIGWLLTTLHVIPGVNWIWVLALGVAGLLTLSLGVDKVTIIVGPFLILCTFASLLRQSGYITFDVEVPSLTIALGTLMLISRIAPVKNPGWLVKATHAS